MQEEEIKAKAIELIIKWILRLIIIIFCTLGMWKFIEILSKFLGE